MDTIRGVMEPTCSDEDFEAILNAIRDAGYDPYAQIYGYLTTGNDAYITRTGNARAMIQLVDKAKLMQYVLQFK